MDVNLFGVRISTGQEVSIKATKEGDLYIAQNLPPYALATAAGRGYQVMASAAAACLASGTRPTTAALGTLWNGEEGGGRSYVVDRIFAQQVASDEALQNWFGLWACVHISMTAPTADITAIKSMSGKVGYGGSARFDAGATVVDDGWFPVSDSMKNEERQTQGGSQIVAPIEGRLIVTPQHGLSIHVVGNDTNLTFRVGVAWYEVQLDLV